MDVDKVARLLEPLMPREILHWRQVLDSADTDLRSLVEKQIVLAGRRVFGDLDRKILLSLPPETKARGAFHLGNVVYDRERWAFGLSSAELLQHVGVFGRSGAGKTNVVFHLLGQLSEKRIPFLFLDWKRTGRHLLPLLGRTTKVYTPGRSLLPFPFNPFIAPPGMEPRVYLHHVVDVLGEAFTLGDGARSLLQKVLSACYERNQSPAVQDLIDELDNMPLKERGHGWRITARRALESLVLAGFSDTDSHAQQELARSLTQQSTILELNGLGENVKRFLIPILGLWIYHAALESSDREKLKLVLVLEEAHHVLYRGGHRAKESVMEMLLRQFRELGVGVFIVDQHPHLISSAALGNTYTSICLNLKDPADISKAAGLSLVEDRDKRYFSMLPVGVGIIKLQDRWREPFLVRFPHVQVKKGSVTDRDLLALMQSRGGRGVWGSDSGAIYGRDADKGQGLRDLVWDDALNDEELGFLEDVLTHRDDGVRVRYARLGLSAERGTRLKAGLVRRGWLDTEIVPIGTTRKVVLRLSAAARKAMGRACDEHVGRESVAHEYWKRYYAEIFIKRGYTVEVEATRVGGRVDVLARNGNETVGIEVETGMSNVVTNVRNCLRSGHSQVLVVATSSSGLEKITRDLAERGLLIPRRVQVVLREEMAPSG